MNQGTNSNSVLKPVLLCFLGLAMITGAYWLVTRPVREASRQRLAQQKQRAAFFADEVPKLLQAEEKRNEAALDRSRLLLNEIFRGYEARLPAFAEEMTSLGMKWQFTKAALKDWWSDSNEARILATGLFEEHVVSDRRLKADATRVVEEFVADLKASRNQMLSELNYQIKVSALPMPTGKHDVSNVSEAFEERLKDVITQRAAQAPFVLLLSSGSGYILQGATESLVVSVLRGIATRLATVAATRGTAVAAGAGVGSLGGPVGIAAGLAIGFALDVWMEKKFKQKLIQETTAILTEMRSKIWNQQKKEFTALIKSTRTMHEEALRKVILGGAE
jgi:hypothetical protein